MKEVLQAIKDAFSRREDTVLAVIIENSGSSPRKTGAMMLCGAAGRVCGTIGGGISEHLVCEEAKTLIRDKTSAIKKYRLYPNDTADIGAQCGGEVTVYLRYICASDAAAAAVFEAAMRFADVPASWLVLELAEGSAPLKLSVIHDDGTPGGAILFPDNHAGLELPDAFTKLKPQLIKENARVFFSLPVVPAGFVYIFGAGHIARELCPLLSHLDFRCVIFDDRAEFAGKTFFPHAVRIINDSYDTLPQQITVSRYDYIVAVTSGHNSDFKTAAFALKTKACYIGVIGSRKKVAFVQNRLKDAGFSDAEIAAPRFHAPIGIAIRSETPAELAVSIAAELIRVRAERMEA